MLNNTRKNTMDNNHITSVLHLRYSLNAFTKSQASSTIGSFMLSGIEGNKSSEMNSKPEIQFCSDLKLINNTDGLMTVEQTLDVDFAIEEMDDDLYRNLISDYITSTANERHFSNLSELTFLMTPTPCLLERRLSA